LKQFFFLVLLSSGMSAQVIDHVRLQGAPPANVAALARLITVQEGRELSPEAVQDSIRLLMQSGITANVEAILDENTLTFKVRPKILLQSIRIRGFSRKAVQKALGMSAPGWFWEEDILPTAREKLQHMLNGEGYLNGEVRLELKPGPDEWEKSLLVNIDRRERLPVERVNLSGECSHILDHAFDKLMEKPFQPSRIHAFLRKTRQQLFKQGYLNATLTLSRIEQGERGIILPIETHCDRPVDVRFEGEPAPRSLQRKIDKLFAREGLKDAKLQTLIQDYEARLHRKGYYRAKITVSLVDDDSCNCSRLVFVMFKGERYTLGDLSFTGNEQLNDAILTKEVGIRVGKRITPDAVKNGQSYIEAAYSDRGFLEAAVDTPITDIDSTQRVVRVTYPIAEGSSLQIGKVFMEGFPDLGEDLRLNLEARAGQPMREEIPSRDLAILQNSLFNSGYLEATVSVKSNIHDGTIDLTYQCQPGSQRYAGKVFIRGLQTINRETLRHDLDLHTGDILSQQKLYDIQEDLYSTGLFKRVDIERVPSSENSSIDHVRIDVEEDKHHAFAYGLGYDTEEQFRIKLGYSMMNLFGRRHYLGLTTRLSNREQHFRLTYRVPDTWGTAFPTTGVVYRTSERWTSFDLLKENAFVEYMREWGPRSQGFLRLEYSVQRPDNAKDYLINRGDAEERTMIYPVLSYVYDSRLDPVYPLRGTFTSFEIRWSPETTFTDSSFVKWFGHQTVHLPVQARSTLILSLRYGGIRPLGSESVPIGERFFSGGRTSHRAYARDTLGIEGETLEEYEPLGGLGVLLANVEFRSLLLNQFGVSVFLDSGNVFQKHEDISLDRLKHGVGVGIFVLTPVGPLRVDYGKKLDPEEGQPEDQWFMSLGFPF